MKAASSKTAPPLSSTISASLPDTSPDGTNTDRAQSTPRARNNDSVLNVDDQQSGVLVWNNSLVVEVILGNIRSPQRLLNWAKRT